jgi:cell filamentation protein
LLRWHNTILKNKLDIKDAVELAKFEAEISSQRAQEPIPDGNLDYAHYRALQRHLFQDVYDWAGEPRKIRIGKGGNWFCFPENIDAEMTKLFYSFCGAKQLIRPEQNRIRKKGSSLSGGIECHSPLPRR